MAWVVVVAMAGGLAIAAQAQMVGLLENRMGTATSVAVTYLGGALVALPLVALGAASGLAQWREVPPPAWFAGAVGLVIIGSIGIAVDRLGVTGGMTLVVVCQFVFAALIDRFGLLGAEVRSLDPSRLAGLALLLVGAWLVLR